MNLWNRILGSLEARLNQPRLSLWRTAYLNLRTLPLSQAIRFPIFVYGKVRLFMLNGKIEIHAHVRPGMITIGRNNESFSLFDHSGFISLGADDSRIIFEGPTDISVNSKIRVTTGSLTFGTGSFIGAGVRIICNGSIIKIGDHNRIAFESVIMNSGFHFVYNFKNQSVGRLANPIILGRYNWVGNRATISGGSITPDYAIICNGSLLNKDYSDSIQSHIMLGGTPAKVVATDIARIFNPQQEQQIMNWFDKHPEDKSMTIPSDDIILI